jgi:hypothetical protein
MSIGQYGRENRAMFALFQYKQPAGFVSVQAHMIFVGNKTARGFAEQIATSSSRSSQNIAQVFRQTFR